MMRSRSIRRIVLTSAIVLLVGYALFEARGILRGPIILIESPSSGDVITDPLIHVTGTARNIKEIRMDGRPIFISETGRIDEPIALLPGYNELTLQGTDRFGKATEVDFVLVYEPGPEAAPPPVPTTASSSAATSTNEAD